MRSIDTASGASQKAIISSEKEVDEVAERLKERPKGPVGIDIGTSHIVMAQSKGKGIHITKQLNAFFTIPCSKFTKKILTENKITFFEKDSMFYVLGYSAENFANMFNADTRRTMENGVLNAREIESITVLQSILEILVKEPKNQDEIICFSMPGQPVDTGHSVVYHESILKAFLTDMGYAPISVNEGLATVMSELDDDNFTGIGISMGGGMCNVCLAYLSVPVTTYSIEKGGDYIDLMVSASVGEPATKIKTIKESSLVLDKTPKDRVETALHIYYDDLVSTLLRSLQDVLHSSDKILKRDKSVPIVKPVPIVLSGGTVLPNGFKALFERELKKVNLPIDISEVRVAEDPLNTTAKGAMIMALSEET